MIKIRDKNKMKVKICKICGAVITNNNHTCTNCNAKID